jgi:hypothetical protein
MLQVFAQVGWFGATSKGQVSEGGRFFRSFRGLMVCRLPRLLDAERWVQLISRSGISDRVTYLLPPGVKVFREDGTVK